MGKDRSRSLAAMAVLCAGATLAEPVAAQEIEPAREIAVAIVDIGADKLYSSDPNVRFVDLTPEPKDGLSRASGKAGSWDHGRIVSEAFVDEYRRLDPTAQITIYTVNPFVQKGISGPMIFKRSMLQQALPKLKEINVKVAITTFGVADKAAGQLILEDFKKADLIVFAAAPNKKSDPGIWPAADPSVISVADAATPNTDFYKARDWAGWVDVVANGQFHKGTVDVQGSSFATPRVAAYGAYLLRETPTLSVDAVRDALKNGADMISAHGLSFPKVGGSSYAKKFVETERHNLASMSSRQMKSAQEAAASNDQALIIAFQANQAGRSR